MRNRCSTQSRHVHGSVSHDLGIPDQLATSTFFSSQLGIVLDCVVPTVHDKPAPVPNALIITA